MISEKQLEANRRNAQHSTGPRTAEGKAVVANNALHHGLRSQRIVIAGEDRAEYDDLRNELIAQFAPVGILEIMLADRIAAGFWRLSRAGRMEAEMLDALQSEHHEKEDNARAHLKRLLSDRRAASERPAGRPCGRLPFKGFDGAKAAWDATEDGKLYASGNWPDDPDYPSPNESFSEFLRAAREAANADPSSLDHAAAASSSEPVFTEQTHSDLPASDSVPCDTPPSTSLGECIAADLKDAQAILKLRRYEAHIERSLFKTLAELQHFQQKRLASETCMDQVVDADVGPLQPLPAAPSP